MRGKEYDQVLAEVGAKLEEVQRQYPDASVEEPFTKGYERGRVCYQQTCNKPKVA
jgi:hypothetical protein